MYSGAFSVAAAKADCGIWPHTTLRFTPAFSQIRPPARTREIPPPPDASADRRHASVRNVACDENATEKTVEIAKNIHWKTRL